MAFSDHKIQSFTRKLSDLPDQPNLSAAELKAYFDSSPEELRIAHNAVCTDAQRLDERVAGIVTQTFGDAIPKSMLAHELQAELDGKAEQTALAAETQAREATDDALQAQLIALQTQKCELYFGTYTGDGAADRDIDLGFRPKALLVLQGGVLASASGGVFGGLVGEGFEINRNNDRELTLTDTGFHVRRDSGRGVYTNETNKIYPFLAFR